MAIQAAPSRALRVALVHASDHGGGAESAVVRIHRALGRLGHESHLFVGSRSSDDPTTTEIARPRIFPGLNRSSAWASRITGLQTLYAPGFRQLMRTLDQDVVHVHTLWGAHGYADLGGLAAVTRRRPTVITLHEAWMMTGHCACPYGCDRWRQGCGDCPDLRRVPPVSRDATRLNWARKRRVIRQIRAQFTTVSRWLAARAAESPILEGQPVTVVHEPIDEVTFVPGSREQARRHLRIADDAFVVMMAGQSVEGVREGIALEGLAAVARCRIPRLLALLIGHSSELAAERARPTAARTLRFQDPAGLAMCYRAADVTLVASTYETFGLIAAESSACGTPVVAFATGGLPEIVDDGKTGWIVPSGDVDRLSAALLRAAEDRLRLRAMGDLAAAKARDCFSSGAIARRYVEVYEMAIAAREG